MSLDLDPGRVSHSRRCTRPRLTVRPALSRPGWLVIQCPCCRAVSVVPDPEPATLDLEDGSP